MPLCVGFKRSRGIRIRVEVRRPVTGAFSAGVVIGQSGGGGAVAGEGGTIAGGGTISVEPRLYGGVVMFGRAGTPSEGGCNKGPLRIHCSTSSTEE